MINNFPAFSKIVNTSFQTRVSSSNAFVADVDGDALYAAYLAAFPAGTNPIFKERSEHDCSCCKQFVRRAGNVITVDPNGTVHTVWEVAAEKAPAPYNVVAKALHELVSNAGIANIYRVSQKEISFGTQKTRSEKDGKVLTWDHFYSGEVPQNLRSAVADTDRGNYRTTVQVFERGLTELSPSAVATVLSLIDENALYRGAEHRAALQQFQTAQRAFATKTGRARDVFVWTNAHGPASRFRNTVAGTLVTDLSSGVDIEQAVKSFESKVAPQNYKRPTALITKAMVEKAMDTVKELGLECALERRFAKIDDISVNDVLWVDSGVKPLMKGGLVDTLMQHAASANVKSTEDDERRAEEINIDTFVKTVLPTATSMELLFKGQHLGNLMSLTAPVHAEPKQLFRWANDFAWSYAGNITDSIKERVKKAGGNVTNAKLRVSLSWFNFDDLDLHVTEPGGHHIYYGSKRGRYGELDVDMNVSPTTREAVENVAFVSAPDGVYRVEVNNFRKRETSDVGFTVEIENAGKLMHFTYNASVRDQGTVPVVVLTLKNGVITKIESGTGIVSASVSQEKWGLHTEQYVKINAVTLSPNFWAGNAVGNKHTFFVLDGAKNDESTRGIYNEFLHPRLEQHRKVFEVIGEKTKCVPTDGQLSGLGFSSTKQDSVIIRVNQGKKQRLYNIQIGAMNTANTENSNEHHQHV